MPKGIYKRGVINRKPHSVATRTKIALANTGKIHSQETIKRIRLAKTGAKYPNRKHYARGITQINRLCLFCKTPFITNSRQPNKKYCSPLCFQQVSNPKWTTKGKKGSEKQREIMRNRTGEKHFAWIKDRTIALEKKRIRGLAKVKELRIYTFHRDDFTCQECGERGGYLEAHHIHTWKNSPELRYDINNLITLCRPCHLKTLFKEKDFEEKYNSIINKK